MLWLSKMLFSRSWHNWNNWTSDKSSRGEILRVVNHIVFVSRRVIFLIPQVVMLLTRLRPAKSPHRFLGRTRSSFVLRWFCDLPLFQIFLALSALNHLRRSHWFEMLVSTEVVGTYPTTQLVWGLRSVSSARETVAPLLWDSTLKLLFAKYCIWRMVS